MPNVIEPAPSGRAKCRGCGEKIASGVLRFGERLPNPFADGEMTHWFHLECAAYKRPEAILTTLEERMEPLEDGERLQAEAKLGVAHRRLPRVNRAERSPTGRARCRSCKELIEKGSWRISLVFYEEGRFAPSGAIHVRCAQPYFETIEVIPRIRRFSPDLSDDDIRALEEELRRSTSLASDALPEGPSA